MTKKELEELNKLQGDYTEQLKQQNNELRERLRLEKASNEFSRTVLKQINDEKELLDIRQDMSKNLTGYIDGLKKLKKIEQEIKIVEDIKSTLKDDDKRNKLLDDALELLNKKKAAIDELNKSTTLWNVSLKSAGKIGLKAVGGMLGSLDKGILGIYNSIKKSGLLEMDKAIRTSALSMGLMSKESEGFRGTMKDSAMDAALLGTSFDDLVKITADYTEQLGTNSMLTKEGVLAINDMAKGTTLGIEGATKMAAEFSVLGKDAESTRDSLQQMVIDGHAMGLNTSALTKNLLKNLNIINKYNFKDGIAGLEKMAKTATKLGLDMSAISPMADKLFNIEGAVEMSAQLQVLGGKWVALADPFKLMYEARNDMEGLTKSIGEAAAESASFAKDGSIQMSSLEMSRLRQVADQTGLAYDDLVTAGKRAFKMMKMGGEIDMKFQDPAVKEFIENTAQFDKDKKAYINLDIGGKITKKFLNQLDSSDAILIQQQIKQKDTLAEQAAASTTFDDQITALISNMKVYFLPVVEELNKNLKPALDNFVTAFKKGDWGTKLANFADTLGSVIGAIGKWVIEWPKLTLGLIGFGKVAGWFIDKLTWISNGELLATGFNMGTSGGGGFFDKVKSIFGMGGKGKAGGFEDVEGAAGAGSKMLGRVGLGAGLGMAGYGAQQLTDAYTKPGTRGNILGSAASGAMEGAGMGALAGPEGAILGAVLGALFKGGIAAFSGNDIQKQDDAVVQFNPQDKFMKVNDSTMIAGTNANGNKDLASALSGQQQSGNGRITPSAMPGSLDVKLSDLNITGSIELRVGQSITRELGEYLIKDPVFVRDISKMINMATARAISGTQPQKV